MADNYCEAAGLIPESQLLCPEKIVRFYKAYSTAWELYWEGGYQRAPFRLEDGNLGFTVELLEGGNLYWASDDYFDAESFAAFMQVCIKNGWIQGPVHATAGWYCSKPRPDEFGGLYVRITGENIYMVNTNLSHLADETIAQIELLANPSLRC
jgi:hypothetical protein